MPARIKLKHNVLADTLSRSRLCQNCWAQKLGLDKGHLSQLANGKRMYPNARTSRKLQDGLGLSFDDLFEVEIVDYPIINRTMAQRFWPGTEPIG